MSDSKQPEVKKCMFDRPYKFKTWDGLTDLFKLIDTMTPESQRDLILEFVSRTPNIRDLHSFLLKDAGAFLNIVAFTIEFLNEMLTNNEVMMLFGDPNVVEHVKRVLFEFVAVARNDKKKTTAKTAEPNEAEEQVEKEKK